MHLLVDRLARQGRLDLAGAYYSKALSCGNDLGLFSEEYDVETKTMLGG